MDNPMTTKTVACRRCDVAQTITAPVANFMAWENGEYIQEALPMLSAGEREMLMSQTCDPCWAELFGEPEDCFDFDRFPRKLGK
tara:strand:+ start:38 stop:289 length:252 start_codon:yes stop_codon:yes gene_type:complete